MNILPFRRSQSVVTDSMAESEMQSSIPPWPVRRVEPPANDGLSYSAELAAIVNRTADKATSRRGLMYAALFVLVIALYVALH